MKIGFIQTDDDDSSELVPGYAEAAADEDDEVGSWRSIIIDFCTVYGFI